jgi:hypothetical protein
MATTTTTRPTTDEEQRATAQAAILAWEAERAARAQEDDDPADDPEVYGCDECDATMDEESWHAHDGLCAACHAAVHFGCLGCQQVKHVDECHHRTGLCTDGYEAKADRLRELVEVIIDDDGRALDALQALQAAGLIRRA